MPIYYPASGGGYTLPIATTNTLGGVRPDGTTITVMDGVISSSGPSVLSGISSDGATQGTATALTATYNVITNVGQNTGVRLFSAPIITVLNRGANSLLVYPESGQSIEALTVNTGYTVAPGASAVFAKVSGTQVYVIASSFQ